MTIILTISYCVFIFVGICFWMKFDKAKENLKNPKTNYVIIICFLVSVLYGILTFLILLPLYFIFGG